jgi:hypothetical protein
VHCDYTCSLEILPFRACSFSFSNICVLISCRSQPAAPTGVATMVSGYGDFLTPLQINGSIGGVTTASGGRFPSTESLLLNGTSVEISWNTTFTDYTLYYTVSNKDLTQYGPIVICVCSLLPTLPSSPLDVAGLRTPILRQNADRWLLGDQPNLQQSRLSPARPSHGISTPTYPTPFLPPATHSTNSRS